jgi:DNA primase
MEYLKTKMITDSSIFTSFQIGFSNGTLLNTIPDEGDILDSLKQMGILDSEGHEIFYNCVVFPVFDENKGCVDLCGQRISDGSCVLLSLPSPSKSVFNYQAAKRSKSIIITESIIDALTLYNAGFKDVIPCYGVNGLTENHLNLFARFQTSEVYICFDKDDVGQNKAISDKTRLEDMGIRTYVINLPNAVSSDKTDINAFFLMTAEAGSAFKKLLKDANPNASIQAAETHLQDQKHYEKTESGFIVQYDQRRYEIRGIDRNNVRCKATIKAFMRNIDKPLFHLDTIDLYSSRSRILFARECATLFGESEGIITEDVARLIEMADSWQPDNAEIRIIQRLTKAEEEEALEFLKDPLLFNRILSDFEAIGITGENSNKLMGYIAAISRKLDEPLSILIQSRSAAGKSTLQDAIIKFIPPEDYVKYTRLTGQALFYKEEDSLSHKLIAVEEGQGAKDASYSIRNIQSSKYLSIAATGKDAVTGKLKTEEYRVKGPVALMITTTEVELDYETANRFVPLTIDESREMTERILQKQREQETLEGFIMKSQTERIIKRHHNAQRLLRPLFVINPYASHLTFPSDSLRARRDHKKYLGLIKAIAFIHQYQREIKSLEDNGAAIQYIEVTLEDIEKANCLASEVLGRTLDELSPPSRLLLRMIREMVEAKCKETKTTPKEYRFRRKDIREWSQWSDFQVKCHIKQLEDMEYLYSITGRRGKEYVYELLYRGGGEDGKPFLMGINSSEQLRKKLGE